MGHIFEKKDSPEGKPVKALTKYLPGIKLLI
jgi:hypothetical protein